MKLNLLSYLLLTAIFASVESSTFESDRQSEFFRQMSLPGVPTSCHRLVKTQTKYQADCLMQWMRLKREGADPGFIHYTPLAEAEGCEISAWCDQLLLNESEPRTTELLTSQSQLRLVLFAVKSASQVNVLDSYLTPIDCNWSLLLSPLVGPPPMNFWRSCWLDRLPDLVRLVSGKTISVELLKDGVTVLKISFDARFSGLNATNWFSKDRIVGSEPDLGLASRTYNYFSLDGHIRASPDGLKRTFFINTNYGGCGADVGVLAVAERYDLCAWAQTGGSSADLPKILYNPQVGLWDNFVRPADYMLVTVD